MGNDDGIVQPPAPDRCRANPITQNRDFIRLLRILFTTAWGCAMFLRGLTIKNVRSIREAALDFTTSEGSLRRWTMLLGENGCGKSTVLRSAALVLAGSDALPHLLGPDPDSWIRHKAKTAEIQAEIQTQRGDLRTISLRLSRGTSVRELFSENHASLSTLDSALRHTPRSYLTMGYGASRRLNGDPDSPFRSQHVPARVRSVATLFSPDAVLEPLESWVIAADYGGNGTAVKATIDRLVKSLMPHVHFAGIEKKKRQLLFRTPDGVTPLAQMSDGYQNVAAWCGDLLRSITTAVDDYTNPLGAHGPSL